MSQWSPPSGSSSFWALALARVVHAAEPWQRPARRWACFIVALTPSQWGDAEHRLAPAVLPDERSAVWGGSWFLATAPPSAGETSSWPVHSPSMLWFWQGQARPMCCAFWGEGWPKLPSPLEAMRNSSVESLVMAHCRVDAPRRVEPTKRGLHCPS
jgi:hypothetical protein